MSEESELPVHGAADLKDNDVEGGMLEDDSTAGDADGEEDEASKSKKAKKKRPRRGKYKSKLSMDHTTSSEDEEEESEHDDFDQVTLTIIKSMTKKTPSSPDTQKLETNRVLEYKKRYILIEALVRPRTASPIEFDQIRQKLEDPGCLTALVSVAGELDWNRYVDSLPWDHQSTLADSAFAGSATVQHPSNPMFTSILQSTAHLRPTDGILHPPGVSLSPLLPHAPLLPGPAPATPAVTTQTGKEHQEQDRCAIKPRQASDELEKSLKREEEKLATLLAEMKAGSSRPVAEVFADILMTIKFKADLKEKARLELAEDIREKLAGAYTRVKKIAKEDRAPNILIP